jgi:hypothetical protein
MSVFESGRNPAEGSYRVVCNLEGLQSIVFGASAQNNIRQSKDLIV